MDEVIEMKFSDNLRTLRKQKGYSQEQLAEKLNVSRQAVSKWESDGGFPEMDKLILLSELFSCTVDSLLKDDLTNSPLMEKELYDSQRNQFSKLITFGVGIILSGLCMYLLLIFRFPENGPTEYIPETVFMCFITIGVLILIYGGMQISDFDKKYPVFAPNLYSQEEIDQFERKFRIAIPLGVTLILIGVIMQIALEQIIHENVANLVFMILVTIAVSIFVYFGTQKSKFDHLKEINQPKEIKDLPTNEKANHLIGLVCGCIMLIATIIFLLWSFLFTAWEISWIVFPIGGILCAITSIIIKGISEFK